MSPSTSMPNLLDDDSPGGYSTPNSTKSPMNRLRVSKFKFNMQRAPSNASRQWDLLLKAAKKKSPTANPPQNHVISNTAQGSNSGGLPTVSRETKQVVIDMRPMGTDHSSTNAPSSAPLALNEPVMKGLHNKPQFRWRGSPTSSSEDGLMAGAPPGPGDGVASLIYQTRELSPLFTHPLASEVSAPSLPSIATTATTGQNTTTNTNNTITTATILPQPYLSSITMLWHNAAVGWDLKIRIFISVYSFQFCSFMTQPLSNDRFFRRKMMADFCADSSIKQSTHSIDKNPSINRSINRLNLRAAMQTINQSINRTNKCLFQSHAENFTAGISL